MDLKGKRNARMGVTLFLHLFLGVLAPAAAEIEMEFTKYPESVIAPVGDEVTFECAVRVPGERLAWRWKPVVPDDDWNDWKDVQVTSAADSISTKLVVEIKEDTPTSLYQCVVWYGGISLVSIPAKLSIARIDLSRNTQEKRVISAPLHNTVVLHCREPLSEPPAVLSWWKETGKGQRKQLETPHGVLVIHNATVEDTGTYGCVATNELSGQTVDLPELTYLKVQHEGNGGYRFLETEDYVGTIEDGVLTKQVRPDGSLRLWCGAVGTPPPKFTWTKEGGSSLLQNHDHLVTVSPFIPEEEGIYSCTANGIRRSWKVVALQPPHWEGSAASERANEGASAHISCGMPRGQPPPKVYWLLNAVVVNNGKGIKTTDSELHIARAEKRHAGIVQCVACSALGCAYDAALLTVVPAQISDQEYSAEAPKTMHVTQQPKRHHKKGSRRNKVVLIPPSRPNVTRMSDESVMVSWSHDNHGLAIQFFKVQYKEAGNSSNAPWQTSNYDIPSHIHSHEIDGLTPNKYYKFRIAAVYSNHDNKLGKSSNKFFLQRGGFQSPCTPVLAEATALSPHSILLNWTWSSEGGVEAEGFYVYYRAVSSAGAYEKVTARGASRSLVLEHLTPDTAYEVKLQAYTAQAPSDFSSILVAKTHRPTSAGNSSASVPGSTTSAPEDVKSGRGGSAMVAAGGAAAAAAVLLALAVTLPLCRRARRPAADKEKAPGESGAGNGYIPAKVPITITGNPMHAEGGDAGVEMSFLHNNNCGGAGDDDAPPRKPAPARQYV
ncbi:interference hedgehog-like [Epargyreus clarus]|uniref:interference hedgehog-like n=1 Tax=Epargyreus clarus TaxID=520877 RepID=UPI003C2CE045